MVQSSARNFSLLSLSLIAFACSTRDTSITHGADGQPEWSRRLAAAVPPGIPGDSARRVMESSGFRCRTRADSGSHLSCDKISGTLMVERRWQAIIDLDAQGRVNQVSGSTALSRP